MIKIDPPLMNYTDIMFIAANVVALYMVIQSTLNIIYNQIFNARNNKKTKKKGGRPKGSKNRPKEVNYYYGIDLAKKEDNTDQGTSE